MADDLTKFPGITQESIAIAIALCDDDNSNIITNLVEIELFDDPYRDIVARCIEHRRTYKRPPGRGNIDDVFAHILSDPNHKLFEQYDNILNRMVEQSERVDTNFIKDSTAEFIHKRQMRASLAQAVERFQKGGANVIEDIEGISRQILKIRDQTRDYGFSLADSRALGFLDRSTQDYCLTGIKELDERGVVPTKKELLAFLSGPNRGKSWYLTHCGKMALLKGWKILHYTLENSDDMTAQRYFQTLFSGVRRSGTYKYAALDKDGDNLVSIRTETLTPDFIIENQEETTRFLSSKVADWRRILSNLRIRRFPSGKLTFEMLEQDLDELLLVHKFKPDLLLVDMPQLMKLPRREKDYTSLDELFTSLRGLAVERDLAVVAPQQGNRSSNSAKNVQAEQGAGSFGIFGIADNLITYSQTPSEYEYGLARLYTQKVRNDRARMTILITQHYDSGQFYMDSFPMNSRLREAIKAYTGGGDPEEEEDGETPKRRSRQ